MSWILVFLNVVLLLVLTNRIGLSHRTLRDRITSAFCLLVTSLIAWKSLQLASECKLPVVLALNTGMNPTFYEGDVLLVTNYENEKIRAGDIIMFQLNGSDIPNYSRVIKVHESRDSSVKYLTKGDNNSADDRELYEPGQLWLEKKHLVGTVKGTVPYIGVILIIANEWTLLKYAILLIAIFYYKLFRFLMNIILFILCLISLAALCVM